MYMYMYMYMYIHVASPTPAAVESCHRSGYLWVKMGSGLSQLARLWHAEAHFDSLFAGFCGPEMRLASMETVPRLSNPWGLTP